MSETSDATNAMVTRTNDPSLEEMTKVCDARVERLPETRSGGCGGGDDDDDDACFALIQDNRLALVIVDPSCLDLSTAIRDAIWLSDGILAEITTAPEAKQRDHLSIVCAVHALHPSALPRRYVAVQTEQWEHGAFAAASVDGFLAKLRRAQWVWTLWEADARRLRDDYALDARALHLAWAPSPRAWDATPASVASPEPLSVQEWATRPYDVVFYGSPNRRREVVIDALRGAGLRVQVVSNHYGDKLHAVTAQARIVLNLHYYEFAFAEVARILPVVARGRARVVTEAELGTPSGFDIGTFARTLPPLQDVATLATAMVSACLEILCDPVAAVDAVRAAQASLAAMPIHVPRSRHLHVLRLVAAAPIAGDVDDLTRVTYGVAGHGTQSFLVPRRVMDCTLADLPCVDIDLPDVCPNRTKFLTWCERDGAPRCVSEFERFARSN